ncbi:MAG: hypothetical protein AAB536_00550 [Patescibacteria group bacterium]
MDKKSIYIIIAVVVVAAALWFWVNQPASAPGAPISGTPKENAVTGSDTTGAINQDLNSIMIEDSNFKTIDNDINSL